MANGFSITINAVDRTSGIFAKVNKHLSDLQAPAKRLGQQVTKFTELTGLKKVSAGFDGVVRSSLGAARSVARVSEPLAAITGAASIGGFVTLIEKWAEFNTTLGFAAKTMGIMPQQLGQLRAAGALAGASADAVQTGFRNLNETLYDVRNGGAPQMAYVMSRLGISMNTTATQALPRLADAIAAIKNPMAQARLATIAFGSAGEAMLPFLRGGSKGLAEYQALAARYGGTTDAGAAAALQFTKAQAAVSQSVLGLTDAIETQLAPVISPLLVQFAVWISHGRKSQFVMHDLAQDAKAVGKWIENIDFSKVEADVMSFGKRVEGVFKGLDRWRVTLDTILGIDPGDPTPATSTALTPAQRDRYARLGPTGELSPAEQNDYFLRNKAGAGDPADPSQKARAADLMSYFQTKGGYKRWQAAGFAAQALRESGFDPQAVNKQDRAHFGVFQWGGSRVTDFEKWAGFSLLDPRATLHKQYDFAMYELAQGKEQAADKDIRLTRNAAEAGMFVGLDYERPSKYPDNPEIIRRSDLAKQLFDTIPAGADASLTPGATGTPGAPGASGQVAVTITHDGVGKVTARSRGNVKPPRIATAMTGASTGPDVGSLY